MSRLMVPISSPTSTSTRDSAARAARPRVPDAVKAAPVKAAAPPMNSRLPIFAMSLPESEAHATEPADYFPQLVLVLLLLALVQTLESLDGRLRLRGALEPRVGTAELVVCVGRVGFQGRHLLQFR